MTNDEKSCDYQRLKDFPENLQEIFAKYITINNESLIPLLQDVQESFGFLSKENLIYISRFLNLPASKVYGVATFYNQFRLTPIGKYIIRVCRGTACHVKGSSLLLEALEKELDIKVGETTSDMKFTLETVACIGACSIAPVVAINEEFFGRMTSKEISSVLDKFK